MAITIGSWVGSQQHIVVFSCMRTVLTLRYHAGLQYTLPATWTALVAAAGPAAGVPAPSFAGNVTLASPALLARLVDLLAVQPALLAGLDHRKGQLAPGYDADIVVRAA
jgi:hypothetical protein